MKKWLIAFFIIILFSLGAIYLFIPRQLRISEVISVSTNQYAADRAVANEAAWRKWWPGKSVIADRKKEVFKYKKAAYRIKHKLTSGVELQIQNKGKNYPGIIFLTRKGKDSTQIQWNTSLIASINPIQRIQLYLFSKDLKNEISAILNHLESYLNKEENLYGFTIQRGKVRDTILVSTKMITTRFPTTDEIYGLINQLRRFIKDGDATETNYPMLHITTQDNSQYQVMVAIPVNKHLPESSVILLKRMVAGNILFTEVKGGPATIQQAFHQLENYVYDNNEQSPAIPFESLVTDRKQEKDTSKWITRIYYPIY